MKPAAPLGSGLARHANQLTHTRTQQATTMLATWLDEHPHARVSWSGGKDSTIIVHLAHQLRPQIPICFFDSGAEYPQTLTYIHHLTHQWDLNLHTYPATPDAITMFEATPGWGGTPPPGIDTNLTLHDALIENPAAAANHDHGNAVIYGLRADESAARRALLNPRKGIVTRHNTHGQPTEHFIAPLWNWTTHDVETYAHHHHIPLNPLYHQMHTLGIPENRRRVGPILNSTILDTGAWAYARALAPDTCRRIETRLPRLAEHR